eukprot:CAMPEP_0201910268 /NCGR_PEP_ID=MMETSP0903-20130614/1702_1 /ASSEMBLY_ACC=CAM_ASM_000552 /TAXON_ID=420261 /ORGANISM="Thalassiosira antarctica, Strain CCMP982" /LENGTH=1016 /DNA_ID=CAMNT_0048444879 /DNA_START=78 /DNA_END=3128 /DNA_ORIENTATION=-
MAAVITENIDPNLSFASNNGTTTSATKPPRFKKKKNLRVSISPKRPTYLSPAGGAPRARGRRRSSSHFGNAKKKYVEEEDSEDSEEEDSDIEFTLDGATDIDAGAEKKMIGNSATKTKIKIGNKKPQQSQQRRRRRSSARFLRLSASGNNDDDDDDAADEDSPTGADNFTSSEHLGEIYRQAIRMNAENKINAGNSWGLKLIENMDKFIGEDGGGNDANGSGEPLTPRDKNAREELKAARKMKSKDDKGRVNFTKASCTLDASVKIYSYRVDDVHLSSYRVLANLNRTDNKKDSNAADVDGDGGGEDGGGGEKIVKKRTGPRGPTETLESNTANINMSKLDSAYDIDPLFHKMSKSFDEGGAKGLLLGNLGVSQHGCHIVFDSKDEERGPVAAAGSNGATKLDNIEEGGEEEEKEATENDEEDFNIDPEEAIVWKESEIDITTLASKLEHMLASYGHRTSTSVPFVPQLESLRHDYALLEEEGFAVDERDATSGRKRLKLYDAPEEEEKEAERSIHVIAMERSRGSVLGMSFDTNFRLSMGDLGDDDDDGGGDLGVEDFGGEGEFAPDDGSFGGAGEFAVDFGGDDGGFDDAGGDSPVGTFVDTRSYNNSKVLLDALCNGDAFYEGSAAGGNSDYAFFDMKKFEKATDGNLWAGSQHWKKKPALVKKDDKGEKKRVMFDDDGEGVEKKERKKAVKKDRVFIDFMEDPDIDAIFQKKKITRRTKKTKKDAYQMPQTEKDFLLPPDANVDISQLTRLFSRPNAIVRRQGNGNNEQPVKKTVGFYDVEDNVLGFDNDDDGDFGGNDDGGFTFAYGEGDEPAEGGQNDADYNLDNFDEVRKVEKINITYATVAKKVDVRRLKKDLWAELEDKTAWVAPQVIAEEDAAAADNKEEKQEDQGEQQYASFKETVEKMDMAQSQNDVTVSFYFICCLHLANEKGLELDSTGLEDFMISLSDGSAPTFGTFGGGFTETANKLSSSAAASGAAAAASSSSKRQNKKVTSYVEEGDDEEEEMDALDE